MNDLKPGDRVAFDVEGSSKSPYGYGVVTRSDADTTLIQPDGQLQAGLRIKNIRKVEGF